MQKNIIFKNNNNKRNNFGFFFAKLNIRLLSKIKKISDFFAEFPTSENAPFINPV